jgi:urease accessory protein
MKEIKTGAARIGVGGPVGSGKTSLIETMLPLIARRGYECAVVTNDLVTQEDAERLKRSGLLAPERIIGVEAGACPHTVIREDPTLNIAAADRLERLFPGLDLIIIESGGDNLASTFSLDLVDFWIFVIDVGAGDDIPRKRGPGVMKCDLLVVNKIDIAPYVKADLAVIRRDCAQVRKGAPTVFTNCHTAEQIDAVIDIVERETLFSRAADSQSAE